WLAPGRRPGQLGLARTTRPSANGLARPGSTAWPHGAGATAWLASPARGRRWPAEPVRHRRPLRTSAGAEHPHRAAAH
ncbi:MAG: hypothetical protein ACRDY2_13585, partial [Acidimicrobiales bacterium]